MKIKTLARKLSKIESEFKILETHSMGIIHQYLSSIGFKIIGKGLYSRVYSRNDVNYVVKVNGERTKERFGNFRNQKWNWMIRKGFTAKIFYRNRTGNICIMEKCYVHKCMRQELEYKDKKAFDDLFHGWIKAIEDIWWDGEGKKSEWPLDLHTGNVAWNGRKICAIDL